MEIKKHIRHLLCEKRDLLAKEEREKSSQMITEYLLSLDLIKQSDMVLVYRNFRSEVSTDGLIDELIRQKKNVYSPKILTKTRMEFFKTDHADEVNYGKFMIREPISEEMFTKEEAVMIIPMVGFDREKNRLGYGGGYYDRYLEKKKDMIKIGIAFEVQKYEERLPVEPFDLPMDYIVTESRIYR